MGWIYWKFHNQSNPFLINEDGTILRMVRARDMVWVINSYLHVLCVWILGWVLLLYHSSFLFSSLPYLLLRCLQKVRTDHTRTFSCWMLLRSHSNPRVRCQAPSCILARTRTPSCTPRPSQNQVCLSCREGGSDCMGSWNKLHHSRYQASRMGLQHSSCCQTRSAH